MNEEKDFSGTEKAGISIIIPTYNRAHTIRTSIQSVLDQAAANWELIIIDDGSNDNTRNVIQDYLIDERINYYFQKNAGVSAARNKGVELSKGDYLIFLDSDDQFLPDLFLRLIKINYTSYDLICWQVSKLIDGKSSILTPRKLEKIYNNITATFLAGSICYRKNVVSVGNLKRIFKVNSRLLITSCFLVYITQ